MARTKDKRLTKAEAETLTKDWTARVRAMGAIEPDPNTRPAREGVLLLATAGGSLLVTVRCEAGSLLPTIFARFEHPELARLALGVRRGDLSGRLNSFSGKFNFHGMGAMDLFEMEVRPLLFPKEVA